jgi:Na+-driven multidrug efflux pump
MKGEDAHLLPMGVAYCRGYAIGVPFFCLAISINQSLQLDGDRAIGLFAVLAAAAVNIIGDIICVFVIHGDLFEIALATSASNLVMFLVMMLHYRPGRVNLLTINFSLFSFKEIGNLISRGIPNAILIASELVRGLVMNLVVFHVADNVSVAGVSIMSNCNIVQTSILSGFFATISIIGGVVAGENDIKGLSTVMKKCLKNGLILSLALLLIMFMLAGIVPYIFTNDMNVVPVTTTALRIMVFALPFQIISGVICGMFQGLQYTRLSIVCYLLRDMIIPSLFMIIFGNIFGVKGVFVSIIVAYAVSLLLIVAYTSIRMKNSKADPVYKLMLLDSDATDYDSFEGSVGTIEEVADISEDIRQYCLSRNCSARMAFITSLAVEEMCDNAITHNNPDNRKHSIDILLTRTKKDSWVLRFRDDYKLFDPCQWLKVHRDDELDDKARKFGIRMIHDLAGDVMYTQLLQMNNLIISFSEAKQEQ